MNRRRVLIETSWNVKAIVADTDDPLLGINRNIVECKVGESSNMMISSSVLIETSWNVKISP